jgi:hypothetical protein
MLHKIGSAVRQLTALGDRVERLQQAVGRIESRQLAALNSPQISDFEFQVFSQWGEDGIIQYLINRIPIPNKVFVEFGIGDYTESNTRFLLKNDNWSGLVIDGSADNIKKVVDSNVSWHYSLQSSCSFITKDNINSIISSHGITGDIGILSVDIDGIDYWVWNEISCIQPRIVICEYNSLFGATHAVTVPYDESFQIGKAHYSGLYWGASIAGFAHLGKLKGYSLVGSNSAGNNIFFVRDDVLSGIKVYEPAEAYVESKFRISRSETGALSFLNFADGREVIKNLDLYDVQHNRLIKASEAFN